MQLLHSGLSYQFQVETVAPFGVMIRSCSPENQPTQVPVPVARQLVREHHLLTLRGFVGFPGPRDLDRYAMTWGQTLSWPFGTVLELVQHNSPTDHIFDNGGVSLHWDGMFREYIPEFQIFYCVKALENDHGGRTTFCDTTRVLDSVAPKTRSLWDKLVLTYRITRQTHYGGAVVSPLVVPHPDQGFPTMRYLEPVPDNIHYVNRPRVEFREMEPRRVVDIVQELRAALYDPGHYYAHTWQTGDVVIADNYSLLHGREPYTSGCGRHLRRVHVLGDPPLSNPALR